MEDLDAELLAVTEGQKRSGRADLSENSGSSAGEFEGMMDSDAGEDDDDDAMLDADDDDDDDEFGLEDDDDDDDYGSKSKASRSRKKPSSSARSKKSKGKPRAKRKSSSKSAKSSAALPSDDEEEEDVFEYEYDENGYGDSADRERLARMNEIDRETLLTERVEARQKELEVWKMRLKLHARESGKARTAGPQRSARSSGRTKASSKSDALQALAEDKRKKTSRALDEVSDVDSEAERAPKREPREEKRSERRDEPGPMDDDEGPELRFADLFNPDKATSVLFMRRPKLIEVSQEPYFERLVVGLYTRVRSVNPADEDAYLLCRIVGVEKREAYSLPNGIRTNYHLRLQNGRDRRLFTIAMTSGSPPIEREFITYRTRTLETGNDLPRREEVDKLHKRAKDMLYGKRPIPTEEENKKHIANMELLYPSRVNWTRKRTEAQTALQIRRQELQNARRRGLEETVEKLEREVETLSNELKEIDANARQFGVKSEKTEVELFQSVAQRNMALNNTNDLLMAKRRNLEAEGGGIDPFARFDTTGQSYFSIKSKGGDSKDVKPDVESLKRSAKLKSMNDDWRSALKTWREGGKRRRISENAVDAAYGVELVGLDDFAKDFHVEKSDTTNGLQRAPPGIDSMYAEGTKKIHVTLPPNAKITTFEEWTKMRSNDFAAK